MPHTGIKQLTPREIGELGGDPTKPLPERKDQDRTATEQLEALLRVTDRQVANIEGAAALDKNQFALLRFLSETLATIVRAQRDAAKVDGEGFDADKEARKRIGD